MKQNEKDELLKFIDSGTFPIIFANYDGSVIDTSALKDYISKISVEKEEVTEVYAIKDYVTGEVIWNAHGCPYKYKSDAEKRIESLMGLGGVKAFGLLTFKLDK